MDKFKLLNMLDNIEDQIESASPEDRPALEQKADLIEAEIRGTNHDTVETSN